MIKAFVFDMDGVLTDTAKVSVELVRSYFSSLGYEIGREAVVKNLGKGMKALFADCARDIGKEIDTSDALSYAERVYPDLLASVPPVRGASEIVKKAQESGMLTAIASAAPEWRVKANVESMGLDGGSFDLILSEKDIVRNKPEPDIYLMAAIRLGLAPKEVLVFEDSESGIMAALSAGCQCAVMTGTLSREEAKKRGATYVFENFSSFPEFNSPETLQSGLNSILHIRKGAKKYGANWITPLERTLPLPVVEKMAKEEARKAMYNAYCPYSKFRVGAAILSAASGRIYAGCNMENASYGATICAERNAITTAVTNEGAIGIDLVVISSQSNPPAQPCGVCLQVMSEFIRPETPVVLISEDGTEERYSYSELLQHPFEFGDKQ